LERVGWILTALGLSEAGWLRLGDRYSQALAQPTPRKLALLVGINQYSSTQALSGCLTDVELQRELLIHRFGFKAEDILTLTEQQATRQQIETAFQEHLTKQAKPSDVVVFHFSGYGRRIQLIEEQSTGELHPSLLTPRPSPLTLNGLVPVDGVMPTSEVPVVNDLLEETLWLLLRSLSTSYVTTILDTSFNNAPNNPLQGNLRVRSFPQGAQTQISAAELIFQQQLRQNLKLCTGGLNRLSCGSIDNLLKPTPTSIMPGIVLAAAGSTHLATEAKWNGFSSGLFTYALTQYLWEATPPTTVQVSLSRVTGVVEQLVGKEQQPQLCGQKSQEKPLLAYYLQPDLSEGADGVVLSVEDDGKTAHLWLAGLPLNVLEYFTAGSKLTLVPSTVSSDHSGQSSIEQQVGEENPSSLAPRPSPLASHLQLQMRSRTGLTAKAQITGDNSANSLQVGQLVQEAVRVLPRDISLTIALDASLERIERVDATSAFSGIPHVSLVTAGEQPADYVFGRVPETKIQESPATLLSASPPSRYGLFSLGQELIPNSAGEAGEAVKVAVHRLVPKLQTLLAAKLWRLTANEGSSHLNVKAKLELINAKQQAIAQRETMRSPKTQVPVALAKTQRISSQGNIPTLPIGSRIQYRIHNDSDRPLYLLLLGLDSSKSAIAFYSTGDYNSTDPKPLLKDIAIAPGETLIVPQTSVDFEWVVHGPPGLAENQLIFSIAKFTQTVTALEVALHPTGKQQPISPLLNPLEVTQAVMQDLHNASAAQHTAEGTTAETISPTSDTYTLDVNSWASLSFIYQVI